MMRECIRLIYFKYLSIKQLEKNFFVKNKNKKKT